MKYQIRQGVFETNSSSTHSIQISNMTIEEAKENARERIRKSYKDQSEDDWFDPDEYVNGDTLYIKGFDIEDGDEDRNVYYIINNWMAKIQYLAMYIYNYAYYLEDYDKESHNNRYYNHDMFDLFEKTSIYKWFKEEIIKYAKLHNITISNVVFDFKYDTYVEDVYGIEDPNKNSIISNDSIKNMVNTIMQDDYILTYMDEAYRPYNKPLIIVM